MKATIFAAAVLLIVVLAGPKGPARTRPEPTGRSKRSRPYPRRSTVDRYCVTCHSPRMKAGGLVLDGRAVADAAGEPQTGRRWFVKYAPA
jgi:hypothetical protein